MGAEESTKQIMPANRRHKIMDHPILALILLPLLYYAITLTVFVAIFLPYTIIQSYRLYALFGGDSGSIAGALTADINSNPIIYIAQILAAVLMLHLFRIWFRKDRNHFTYKTEKGKIAEGLLLGLPLLITAAINLMSGELVNSPKMILMALLMGFTPGFCEEVTNRILPVANFMRVWKDPKKIPVVITVTGIVFALVHVTNLIAGADPMLTVMQVAFAFGAGALFAAVYLRTGSMLGIILYHTAIDFTAFLNASLYETGGVLTQTTEIPVEAILLDVGRGVLFALLAYFYVRPSKRAEIRRVWDAKWNIKPEDDMPVSPEEAPILAEKDLEDVTGGDDGAIEPEDPKFFPRQEFKDFSHEDLLGVKPKQQQT